MENNKLSLPVTILIASVVLGGFYYSAEKNKQDSIERQQQVEQTAKTEQAKKEYSAKQKIACLDIYASEGKKWNNVTEWNYDEGTDKCQITYNDPKKKTKAECDENLEATKAIYKDEPVPPYAFMSYLHCVDGTFTKEF